MCAPLLIVDRSVAALAVDSHDVEFYYLTEFTESIVVSLNIGNYAFLKEVALMHAHSLRDAKNALFNLPLDEREDSEAASSSTTTLVRSKVVLYTWRCFMGIVDASSGCTFCTDTETKWHRRTHARGPHVRM